MLSSINGDEIIPKELYLKLKEKVKNGSKLYISQDTGFLLVFEELTENKIIDSEVTPSKGS